MDASVLDVGAPLAPEVEALFDAVTPFTVPISAKAAAAQAAIAAAHQADRNAAMLAPDAYGALAGGSRRRSADVADVAVGIDSAVKGRGVSRTAAVPPGHRIVTPETEFAHVWAA